MEEVEFPVKNINLGWGFILGVYIGIISMLSICQKKHITLSFQFQIDLLYLMQLVIN